MNQERKCCVCNDIKDNYIVHVETKKLYCSQKCLYEEVQRKCVYCKANVNSDNITVGRGVDMFGNINYFTFCSQECGEKFKKKMDKKRRHQFGKKEPKFMFNFTPLKSEQPQIEEVQDENVEE